MYVYASKEYERIWRRNLLLTSKMIKVKQENNNNFLPTRT